MTPTKNPSKAVTQAGKTSARRPKAPATKPTRYIPRNEAADVLGISGRTLERMAQNGEGPPHLKIGTKALYPADELDAWARAQLIGLKPSARTAEQVVA